MADLAVIYGYCAVRPAQAFTVTCEPMTRWDRLVEYWYYVIEPALWVGLSAALFTWALR